MYQHSYHCRNVKKAKEAMSLRCDVGGSVVRNDIANENRKWLALCRVSCLSRPLLRDSIIQLFS